MAPTISIVHIEESHRRQNVAVKVERVVSFHAKWHYFQFFKTVYSKFKINENTREIAKLLLAIDKLRHRFYSTLDRSNE